MQNFDLRTNRSRGPGSMVTAISERIVATYTYTFNDKNYIGNRVDFSFGSDNFSGSRRRKQPAALRSGKITVFVNPEDPQDSVIDRSLPLDQALFAIVFLLFPAVWVRRSVSVC